MEPIIDEILNQTTFYRIDFFIKNYGNTTKYYISLDLGIQWLIKSIPKDIKFLNHDGDYVNLTKEMISEIISEDYFRYELTCHFDHVEPGVNSYMSGLIEKVNFSDNF